VDLNIEGSRLIGMGGIKRDRCGRELIYKVALPTDQIQLNKLLNKSIKYTKILFQIKQI
jgi:hypothetical protein